MDFHITFRKKKWTANNSGLGVMENEGMKRRYIKEKTSLMLTQYIYHR